MCRTRSSAPTPTSWRGLREPRGREQLRNVREPVELFAAVRTGHDTKHELAVDPVRRMAVDRDRDRAAGRLIYQGTAYLSCTPACAGAFAPRPDTFARTA
jgi:YHS domain-containing protein